MSLLRIISLFLQTFHPWSLSSFLPISLPLSVLLFLILPSHLLLQWLPLLLTKEESVLPALLKARTPLVLLKASLMRSLSALPCLYETPGTPLVCSFLKCTIVKPLHPLMPGYFLDKQVSLVPLKSQTLERFLISRSGGDSKRWFPSFSISSLGRSKVGPFGWIRSFLTRSLWVVWSAPTS